MSSSSVCTATSTVEVFNLGSGAFISLYYKYSINLIL